MKVNLPLYPCAHIQAKKSLKVLIPWLSSKYWVCLIGARILKTVDVIDLEFVFANGRFGRFGRPAEPPAPKAEGLADFGMILVSIWKL